MDTKSKNRHKLGIVLILGVILLATVIVLGNYNTFYKNAKKEQDSLTQNYRTSESFMKTSGTAMYCIPKNPETNIT